jgi:glycosyltransferase involved in cell wall biosynthesis
VKIAFCGHSYHRVTQSTVFLRELLARQGEMIEFWDESWLTGVPLDTAPIVEGAFDAVVVFQMELLILRLARAGLANLTFFPMYDGCHSMPDSYWRSLAEVKIVSFSSTLHEKLQRLGARGRFVRYWPDPQRFEAPAGETALAGYFWQRQQDITWETIRHLLGEQRFDRFTVHQALDPSYGDFVTPSDADVQRHGIAITQWYANREEAAAQLRRHNVYFAPRLREGIGMSFLEAMARGFLVVAPDRPTMNEYIVSGVNGLLYDPADPRPLDFTARARLGAAARRSVERGWQKWSRSTPALLQYVLTPTADLPAQAHWDAFDPLATENLPAVAAPISSVPARADAPLRGGRRRMLQEPHGSGSLGPHGSNGPGGSGAADAPVRTPAVTVAVVTRNAQATLPKTLESILRQDWPDKEVIVLDGASDDGTVDILRQYDARLDHWESARDDGPYEAMNSAANIARGRYIIFMNAGDWFHTTDALALALAGARTAEQGQTEPDIIYGHHVYRDVSGRDEMHMAADFAQTWARLREGDVGWSWLSGVPGHQATLTRTAVLRANPFRRDLRIAADHELLYRLARSGAHFHHCGAVLATYVGGGMSWKNQDRCLDEWRRIATEYSARPEKIAAAFDAMRSELEASALRRRPWPGLLKGVLRGRHAVSVLAWRARKRWERMRQRRQVRAKVLRVDFSAPDLGRHIDLVQGLSSPEGWGRWSDGERVRIDFNESVRNPYRLSILIRKAFGANVGREMIVRIGAASYRHRLANGEQRFCAVLDHAPERLPSIELTIPHPVSPQSLGESTDHRRLGIVLGAIEVQLR